MLEQLGPWQWTILILTGAFLIIPWAYGILAAIAYGYRTYFALVVRLFGVDPFPGPGTIDRPATDGGRHRRGDRDE